MRALIRPVAAALAVSAASPGLAQEPASEGPLLLLADDVIYEAKGQIALAEGNVEISRAGQQLFADRVRYDQTTGVVEAEGNVMLLDPVGEAYFADKLVLSEDLSDGVADALSVRLADESLFAAARGRRIGGNRTELDKAVYSPCELCPDDPDADPLWQIKAERIEHDQEEHQISYRDAFFELGGVPVLYTPYFSHPDPTVERKSGFLVPSFGNNSDLGVTVETPYYFALAPNYDFTFAPVFTTQEGAVLAGEYRHLVPNGRYNLGGSITYATGPVEVEGEPPPGNEIRGNVLGDGRFDLGDGYGWGYDVSFASDDTYLQRYGISNENVLENRLFGERVWDRNYASINAYGFQGLRPFDVQGEIPIALPVGVASWISDPWKYGSNFTFDGQIRALTRTEGLDSRVVSGEGGFELPWIGPIGDRYFSRLSLRTDVYNSEGDPITLQDNGTNTTVRAVPRATFGWSWPLIGDRIGESVEDPLTDSTLGVTPLIEPIVTATFAPDNLNDTEIPNEDSRDLELDVTNVFEADRFPGIDRTESGGHVSYGVRLGLFGDQGERLNAVFGQSYRLYGQDVFFLGTGSGLDDRFSDFVGEVDFAPVDWLDVGYRFRLDQDSLSLERNELASTFGLDPILFDINYVSLNDDPDVVDEFNDLRAREEIRAGVLVRLSRAFAVRAQTRQDLEAGQTIANNFGLIYRNPCLLLVAGFEQQFTRNRDATDVSVLTVRVALTNLGEFGAESALGGLGL